VSGGVHHENHFRHFVCRSTVLTDVSDVGAGKGGIMASWGPRLGGDSSAGTVQNYSPTHVSDAGAGKGGIMANLGPRLGRKSSILAVLVSFWESRAPFLGFGHHFGVQGPYFAARGRPWELKWATLGAHVGTLGCFGGLRAPKVTPGSPEGIPKASPGDPWGHPKGMQKGMQK